MSITRPSRTQLKPSTPSASHGIVCSGHKKKAAFFTAGSNSKNPGRSFYTCPLGRNDESRCKFFKWADELEDTPSTSKAARLVAQTNTLGQTLGQTPKSRTPTKATRPADLDELDWASIDVESMEQAAFASTPQSQSSQQTPSRAEQNQSRTPFQSRLLEAVEEGRASKRNREDSPENPFAPSFRSPSHHALSGTLECLSELSEHIHRQDRLLAAADKAKEGFRKTIKNLQERNQELESRIKELGG